MPLQPRPWLYRQAKYEVRKVCVIIICIYTHNITETNRHVNRASVAMATLSMRRTASNTSIIRFICIRIVDTDNMPTMWAVADIQRSFSTLLSKRESLYSTCNRVCRISVGKRAVGTQNMEDAPLREASQISAAVCRYTTFFVFWASFTYVKEATATFPHAMPLLRCITMLRPMVVTSKSGLLWC